MLKSDFLNPNVIYIKILFRIFLFLNFLMVYANEKNNIFKPVDRDSLELISANGIIESIEDTSKLQRNILDEILVLGSRGKPRSSLNTPVPIDVVDVSKLSSDVGQYTVASILNYVAPSFTSTTQSVNDATDHIDPASLRGLSPDQTLVLVNGKRRHPSAIINTIAISRGSGGTDLNALAASSINNIEILRDGASAQYGSDAIAGVINIDLKKNIGHTYASVLSGFNVTQYQAYTQQGIGNFVGYINPQYVKHTATDGFVLQANVNHGFKLNKKNDFINIGITYDRRNYTTRAGELTGDAGLAPPNSNISAEEWLSQNKLTRNNFRLRSGQSAVQNIQGMLNSIIHLGINHEFYFFGDYSYREGQSGGIYRLPFGSNNNRTLYPFGFLPFINSRVQDYGLSVGVRGLWNKWHYDVSNTFGGNYFKYIISNSANISAIGTGLAAEKQTTFNAGALSFLQNTTNIDFNRNFDVLHNLNVAFGVENRFENYQQIAGEEASWANYQRYTADPASGGVRDVYNGTFFQSILLANGITDIPAGGSQVFPGFQPQNALNKSRNSIAAYANIALDVTKKFLIDVAVRYEYYTDFGSNVSEKLALRYKFNDYISIRASGSTGFRAPSLQQRYLYTSFTKFSGGALFDAVSLPNDSKVAQLLGINPLKPEISYSGNFGLTAHAKALNITLDGFYTYIKDRIIYTDAFSGNSNGTPTQREVYHLLLENNAYYANFFANAVNSQTFGVEGVVSYLFTFAPQHSLKADLSGVYSQTQIVGEVKTSPLLADYKYIYLSPANRALLVDAFPRSKVNLLLNYSYKNFSIFARESFIGSVNHVEDANTTVGTVQYFYQQKLGALFTTDLSVSYLFPKNIRITLGVNNLFDVYPNLINNSKGKYIGLETNPLSTNYNKIVDTKTARELGIQNNDGITMRNQFNYSRVTTQVGVNGRFLFARIEINF